MSLALGVLAARTRADAPPRGDYPAAEQYERYVQDAVRDLGSRAGRVKAWTLEVVSGTAAYTLPADFLKLVELQKLTGGSGALITGEGIIPLSATFSERLTIANGVLTLIPTPTYSLKRTLWYQAGWAPNETGDAYPELGETEAAPVVLFAVSRALTAQANKAAQEAWQYQIGDERVSKERLAEALRQQAKQAMDDYLAAVDGYRGGAQTYTVRASYAPGDYE